MKMKSTRKYFSAFENQILFQDRERRIGLTAKYLTKGIPITDKTPLFNVQCIHTDIKKDESLGNK